MLRWLVLPMVVFAYLAATVSAAAPRDRDHDRLPDRWERSHHLSTTSPSAKRDPDGDRLKNRLELRLRTHPRRADTDGDRLRDGAEVRRFHTNPRKRDTDGDSFSDRCELRKGTNPRKRGSRPKRRCSKSLQAPPTNPAPGDSPPSGGFPGASSTGVPAGTVLSASGGLTISTAGAVIDAREITGQVVVNAPNVTIRRSRIRSNSMWVVDNNSTGLVIEDSEIMNRPVAGQNNCHNAIGDANFTVRRTELTGCENAANVGGDNVTFVDSWMHDLDTSGPSYVWGNDPHTDGLQMSPGADNIVVRHNTIDPSPGGGVTAPIIMGVNGSQSNVWIEDNYLDGNGAAYAIYANRQPSTNVHINRNRMLKGAGGYTACVKLGNTVTEFNDNRDATTNAPLPPDNGAGGSCTN
jgi:Bacterial TSP3 repeat